VSRIKRDPATISMAILMACAVLFLGVCASVLIGSLG